MKTFEQCCREVAEKNYPNSPDAVAFFMASSALMHPMHQQAAHLYAQEKLKGLLEVAKQEAAQWQTKSDKENDISNKAAYSMTAYAVTRIANRIEELIGENTKHNTPCSQ